MARNFAVHVGEHLERFIDAEVAEGRFRSPNEVIETALQMLEERETRLAKLRAAFDESGPARAANAR
jgi:antitoxin ParD1/3/4